MNRIRELRKSRGLSQVQLAAELNIHQTAVSQWETGRTDPDVESARQLSAFFGVSMDYLLGNHVEELDEVYLNLARAARDRNLQLDAQDIDFLLDFAQKLKDRDGGKHR